jgi:hypothetical protein
VFVYCQLNEELKRQCTLELSAWQSFKVKNNTIKGVSSLMQIDRMNQPVKY